MFIIEEVQKQFLDMENKVLLLDDLGKKYGETHIYHNLKTPAEAIKLLCINHPELVKDLVTSHEQGIFYKVTQVGQELNLSDLNLPLGSHDLVITPVITGSGDVGKILVGVGLVLATGGFGAGFGGTALFGSAALGSIGANLGAALVLGGIANIIAPQNVMPGNIDFDGAFTNFTGGPGSLVKGADGRQSFAYTGPTNVSGLGKTIPVVYGQVLTGSLITGAQIIPESENTTKAKFFRKPGRDTFTLNSEPLKFKQTDSGGITGRLFKKKVNVENGRKHYKGKSKTLSFNDNEQDITLDSLNGRVTASKSGKLSGKRYRIAFSIKGLIDRVGRDGTTFIDGFITYQVIIKTSSSNELAGKHQMTIRGLLQPSNAHKVEYLVHVPFVFVPGQSKYRVYIKIIDHSLIEDKCEFKVVEHGQGIRA